MSDSSREDLFPRVSASGGWPLPYEEMEGASTSQTDKQDKPLHIDYDFEELRQLEEDLQAAIDENDELQDHFEELRILEEDQQALIIDMLDQDHFEELRQQEEDLQAAIDSCFAIDDLEEQSSL